MGAIKLAERLMGIMFWAQHYTMTRPAFEVYRYLGYQPDNGMHYFQAVKSPYAVIGKNVYQIQSKYFQPFCIDDALIRAELDAEGKMSAYL